MVIRQADSQRHIQWMAEVAATFSDHEVERRIKAARGMEGADRLLQNEVGSRVESFLCGRLPIQHRKGYRFGIALGLAKSLEEIESVLQIVAVDDDCVELALRQEIAAGMELGANYDIDGDILQRGTQYSKQIGVTAEEEGVQIHGIFDIIGPRRVKKVTLVLDKDTRRRQSAVTGEIRR